MDGVPQIELVTVAAVPTAVVASTSTFGALPTVLPRLFDRVYAWLDGPGADIVAWGQRGHNVVLYNRDDGEAANVDVEVGIQVGTRFPAGAGDVRSSELPAGVVARATHRGHYAGLGDTHAAVRAWCAERGHTLAGPAWEVYGDWQDDPSLLTTEVCYLVRA